MNVLMVDQFGEIGGAQRCLLDLLTGWPADEGRVIVAAPEEGRLLASVRKAGFETRAISCGPYALGGKTALDVWRFSRDLLRQRLLLRRMIQQNAIDVVYVNGPRVLPAAAAAARGRCRLVFHAHNHLARWYEMALLRFALAQCPATVVACCEHVARPLRARLTRDVQVIENGVPEVRFRPHPPPVDGHWRLGIVGRISAEKGHLELIDAVRALSREGRHVTLSIVGAAMFSAGAYEAEVRRRAEGLDVRFTGWTDQVGSMLGDLDLLVAPSIAEPGLPRIVLEAFSAGVPVVAFPTGGIPEAVLDRETGFLARECTATSLVAALASVMQLQPAELLRVTRNARAAWEARWNVDRWRGEVMAQICRGSAKATAARRPASAEACLHGGAAEASDDRISVPR